jgi:hypothetical protein
MNIKILVSTHKPYAMPEDTTLYLPIQVGCDEVEERLGYQCDNTGDNISYKHRWYSDLSAVYWGWKNLDVDYMGSCHYRRYFVSKKAKSTSNKLFRYILSREELEELLNKCPVIVAKPRNYFIETNEQQYVHAHNARDLRVCREVVGDLYPDYLDKFDEVLHRTWSHKFNTFIMDREHLDSFCTWLFDILFEVDKRVNLDQYDTYQGRVCGYLAERLMDVWLEHDNVEFQELKLAMLENPHWEKKIINFLKRKFLKSARPSFEE